MCETVFPNLVTARTHVVQVKFHTQVVAHVITRRYLAPPNRNMFVVFTGQIQRAIDILQFGHPWYDDRQLCIVMTVTRKTLVFSQGGIGYSFAFLGASESKISNTCEKHVN